MSRESPGVSVGARSKMINKCKGHCSISSNSLHRMPWTPQYVGLERPKTWRGTLIRTKINGKMVIHEHIHSLSRCQVSDATLIIHMELVRSSIASPGAWMLLHFNVSSMGPFDMALTSGRTKRSQGSLGAFWMKTLLHPKRRPSLGADCQECQRFNSATACDAKHFDGKGEKD